MAPSQSENWWDRQPLKTHRRNADGCDRDSRAPFSTASEFLRAISSLLQRRPDTVNIVMVFQFLEKLAHLGSLIFAQRGIILRQVTSLARDNRPTILRKPF
jgi:hypothetical protein